MTPLRLLYVFGLWTCRLGNEFKLQTNPFTGEELKYYMDHGMSLEEREATRSLLQERSARSEKSDLQFYHLRFRDDVEVSVGLRTLENTKAPVIGAEMNIIVKRLTDEVLQFVVNLASAANMAMTVTDGSAPKALTREPTDPILNERWPNVVVVRSPDELRGWVETYVVTREVI